MLGNTKGRLFVVTKNGYMGLAPAEAQHGKLLFPKMLAPRTRRLADQTGPADNKLYAITGCRDLMLLRVTASSHYVVGACHIHGFSDGEPLLGSLPAPWQFRAKPNSTGTRVTYFYNPSTGEERNVYEDLRLSALPAEWVRL